MLRRDTEYVLVWNAQGHCWLARPVTRQDGVLVPVGSGTTAVQVPAWGGSAGDCGAEE